MIKAITFTGQNVTADNDAAMHDAVGGDDRVVKGCEINHTTGSISVSAGYFFAHGREIQITGTETVQVDPAPATVPSLFVFEIDMDNNAEVTFKVITGTPVQDDITSGTGKYQLVFAKFNNTQSGIAALEEVIARCDYMALAYEDVEVEVSAWEADATYEDYPYKADIELDGATKGYIPTVVFAPGSGDFASICEALDGVVRIYAADIPDEDITIPTIMLQYAKVVRG